MREILFRGKSMDNGKWVIGLLARYDPKFVCANIVDRLEILVPVNVETVGQYTGFTDKNGKKIFEGDIVQSVAIEDERDWKIWIVGFDDGCFLFSKQFLCFEK